MTTISETKVPTSSASGLREITVAHSPDSDDAFMFYGLATNKVRAPGLRFTHTLCDIETLNQQSARRRLRRDCDFVSRLSVYPGQVRAHVLRRQRGRRLRPDDRLVRAHSRSNEIKTKKIAVPGTSDDSVSRAAISLLPESKPKSYPSTRSSRRCWKASTKPG